MAHLHIPDGVLPPLLWMAGLTVALLLLFVSARSLRGASPQGVAFRGAFGGIMLAVMAIPVPFAAMEYCLTLTGPAGVLLGPAASFQVVFVVSAILALLGQGGFTVVGLNALVMGAGAALARPIYLRLTAWLRPAGAMALATAASQLISTALWLLLLAAGLRLKPSMAAGLELHGLAPGRLGVLLAIASPVLALGIAVESAVGFGLARFLERVRPDLLPRVTAPPPPAALIGNAS